MESIPHTLRQPPGFYPIFFIELWERFGFYGLQALLVLFMVQHLHYTDADANTVFASYNALVFLFPAVGGYIGDKILGTKRTILLGAGVLTLGYFCSSLPWISNHFIVLPLAIIAMGNALFKANPSSLLSKVYLNSQANSDSGFTLYYMAINIGGFISMILTPFVNKYYGWHVAFFISCLGLIVGIVNFCLLQKNLKHLGAEADFYPLSFKKLTLTLGLISIMTAGFVGLLQHPIVLRSLLLVAILIYTVIFLSMMRQATVQERRKMLFCLILFFQATVFFILYFQAPTSLTLFALRNVNHTVLGFPIEPASFQALNPLWIILLSPAFALLYQTLHARGRDFSLPSKFALGTLLAGSAYLILTVGGFFADAGVISSTWLVLAYLLQSSGELLVSALGLSLVSQFIPQRIMGFTMGLWFLCFSVASIIAGKVATTASITPTEALHPIHSLPIYLHLFTRIGILTVLAGLLMALCSKRLSRLAEGQA